jgi:hypothetical protein
MQFLSLRIEWQFEGLAGAPCLNLPLKMGALILDAFSAARVGSREPQPAAAKAVGCTAGAKTPPGLGVFSSCSNSMQLQIYQ